MKYRYFVSFVSNDIEGCRGYGNIIFDAPTKITTMEDIRGIQDFINDTKCNKWTCILNLVLLEEVN